MPLILESDGLTPQKDTVESTSRVGQQNLAIRNKQEDTMTPKSPDIGITGVIGRSFLTHTDIGSTAIRSLSGVDDNNIPDANFDVVNELDNLGRVQDYNSDLVMATSKSHLDKLLNFQDQMQRFEDEIQQYSGHGQGLDFAVQMIGNVSNLIPLAVGVKGAKFLARASKGAAAGAVLGGASMGLQESILQSNIPGRSDEVGLKASIIAGAAFGGLLGGLVGGVSNRARRLAEANLANELQGIEGKYIVDELGEVVGVDQNISAALNTQNRLTTRTDEGVDIATEMASKVLSPGPLKSITVETITSPLASVRRWGNSLLENNFILNKTRNKGMSQGTAAETMFKLDTSEIRQVGNEVLDNYKTYVQRAKKSGATEFLNKSEFNEQVYMAQRAGGKHNVPEVAQAAAKWDERIAFMKSELKRTNQLAEDLPEGIENVYNNKAIIAERNNGDNTFLEALVAGERKRMPELTYEDALEIAKVKRDYIIGLDGKVILSDLVDNFINSKGELNKLLNDKAIYADPMTIEKYLVKDAAAINTAAYRQGMALVRYKDALSAQGFNSVDELKQSIRDEAREYIAKGDKTQDWSAVEADQIKKLDEYTDIFLGRYTKGDSSAFRNIRKYNTLIRLGGVVISSLGDIGMNVYRHGLYDTVFKGYLPFLKQIATNWDQFKIDTKSAKDIGVAFDLITDRVYRMLDDSDTPLGQLATRTDEAFDTAVDYFGVATGLTFWNNMNRMVAGHLSTSRTIRNMQKGFTNLSKKEQQRLLALGIDERVGNNIAREFKKWGSQDNLIPNFKNWDKETADIFKAATIKEVDATILLPNKGDFSRFSQQSGWTKMLFQFKSYGFAMTNKVTLNTINRADANMLQGIPVILGLASLGYVIKEKIAGREPDLTPTKLFNEAVSRSGLMGLAFDYAGAFNPWGGSSKYGDRNFIEQLGGPTVGTIGDLYSVGTNAAQTIAGKTGIAGAVNNILGTELEEDKPFSVSNSKKLRSLVPMTGLFYTKKTLDRLFVNSLATNPDEE